MKGHELTDDRELKDYHCNHLERNKDGSIQLMQQSMIDRVLKIVVVDIKN